ncbi:MAG: hypothetical protein KJ593_03295 [Candidatus Omnitrophica bacterium]|nr:hypothetical protein [Candidatus Omnitrophota bacterium]
MRKIIQVLAVVTAISAGSFAFGQSSPQAKVIAYYFHGSFRCFTCTNMEKFTRDAIETNFKDALASGNLEFKAVNVEERGNEHFVDDYKLYTKSLILSLVKDGKEVKSKNLDKIWELARNKQKFMDYVTGELSEFMKDTQ